MADGERALGGPSAPRLARNALGGAARNALPAVLALAVTPYALVKLGEARFGLWALAGIVLTLARVLDLGLQRAMVREVALADPTVGSERASAALSSGRGGMAVIGLSYLAAVWLLRDVLTVQVLRLPPELWAEARYVLVVTAAVATTEALFIPYVAALDGLGRMDVSTSIDAAQRVVSSLGVAFVLAMGWGLVGLVWKNVATAVLAGVTYRLALGRRSPVLASVPLRLNLGQIRRLVSFGRHVQAVNASMLVLETAAKVTIGRGPGVAAVATFELAWRVVSQGGGALLGAATAVFPAAAEHHGRDREPAETGAAVRALYAQATRYLAWATLPSYGILAALAGPFVHAWVGAGREQVATSIVVLSSGFVVGVLAAPAHMVAQATGRERVSSTAAIASVIVAAAVWLALVPSRGLAGAVAGASAGVAVGGLLAWVLFARAFGTGWYTVGCLGVRGPVAAGLGALAAWRLGAVLPATLPGVGLAAVAGLALFAAVLASSGAIGQQERALARTVIQGNLAMLRQSPARDS